MQATPDTVLALHNRRLAAIAALLCACGGASAGDAELGSGTLRAVHAADCIHPTAEISPRQSSSYGRLTTNIMSCRLTTVCRRWRVAATISTPHSTGRAATSPSTTSAMVTISRMSCGSIDGHVCVRSERQGPKNGRTYRLAWCLTPWMMGNSTSSVSWSWTTTAAGRSPKTTARVSRHIRRCRRSRACDVVAAEPGGGSDPRPPGPKAPRTPPAKPPAPQPAPPDGSDNPDAPDAAVPQADSGVPD